MTEGNPGPADYERALASRGLGDVIVAHRRTTGSTNDDARALAAAAAPRSGATVALVIADEQTQGRGRGRNSWSSPKGSISMTVSVPGVDASRLGTLPLGVGASVADAFREIGAPARVKWPNDVLLDDRKVCGILCESNLLAGLAHVFIGVGVNVDAASVDSVTLPRATALGAHGFQVDRPALVADITARILGGIRTTLSGAQVVERWRAVSVPWWGETVFILEGDIEKRVTLLDVNPAGHLVVRDEMGAVRSLVSGEVRQIRTAAE